MTLSEPLPCFLFNFKHSLLRQGTGTADHLTLLRLFSLFQRRDNQEYTDKTMPLFHKSEVSEVSERVSGVSGGNEQTEASDRVSPVRNGMVTSRNRLGCSLCLFTHTNTSLCSLARSLCSLSRGAVDIYLFTLKTQLTGMFAFVVITRNTPLAPNCNLPLKLPC